MNILTRDFGELEINVAEIITFSSPVYGYENLKNYVLLFDDHMPAIFSWLQSIEETQACFILVDPQALFPDYQPVISKGTCKLLNLEDASEAVLRTITVIPEDFSKATVNLKSPIVINPCNRCAAQIIVEEDYPVRASLMGSQQEEPKC